MPTPSSGTISIQQINAEFGRGNNLNAYRGTTWWTPAGASGTFPSGAIAMSDFYNKQPNSPTFSFTISSNQTNANLRTLAVNAGWNQTSQVVATIAGGVYMSSNSTGTPGLTVNGSFPNGVQLVNNGLIVGMGGAGGNGSIWTVGRDPNPMATAGSVGGLALSASVGVSITNNGTIGGGGGGGGGGGSFLSSYGLSYAGGGGGGGQSSAAANSAGGAAGAGGESTVGQAGGVGTVLAAGAGGAGQRPVNQVNTASSGGNGGSRGAGGSAGGQGATIISQTTPGAGGSGGAAVSGNANITWLATGTRLGAIT